MEKLKIHIIKDVHGNVIHEAYGADLKWVVEMAIARGISLANADLRNTDLSNICIRNAFFKGANFEGANLSNSDFFKCNFVQANMKNVNFDGATLMFVAFGGTDLTNTIYDENFKVA